MPQYFVYVKREKQFPVQICNLIIQENVVILIKHSISNKIYKLYQVSDVRIWCIGQDYSIFY